MSLEQNGLVSRRDFLKLSALGIVGLAFRNLPEGYRPETDVGLKNVEPDFFFVWHTSEKDLDGLEEHIENCDVFVPEFVEWTQANEDYLNEVSSGRISKEQMELDYGKGFFGELLLALHGKNKVVRILDIHKGHSLDSEFRELEARKIPDFNQTFEERKNNVYNRLRDEADWLRRREDYVLRNLSEMVSDLKRDNPLKYDGKIKVLMEYGVCHTRLMHILSGGGENKVNFKFPENENVYLHSDEAKRRFWFGLDIKDPKDVALPNEKLINKVVLEEILMPLLCVPNLSSFENTAKAVAWFRDVIDKFDIGEPEIKDIWNYQLELRKGKKGLEKSEAIPELKALLISKLKEKGVDGKYLARFSLPY